MSIFDKRINYKPFEYAEILDFTEAINKSFWVHSEIDFTADIQDFHSHLEKNEKEAIKKSLLAIAQIGELKLIHPFSIISIKEGINSGLYNLFPAAVAILSIAVFTVSPFNKYPLFRIC